MLVFLDLEASSLAKEGYPIEVGWVFEDGRSEGHLIRPAPDWTDWDPRAEAIHRISRAMLERDGVPHGEVAARMVEQLHGHDLVASAPSWDGKWLSRLLRAAGLPRHSLRLRDSDDAVREAAAALLGPAFPHGGLEEAVSSLVGAIDRESPAAAPAHRAVADAEGERQLWLAVRTAAEAHAAGAPR